MTTLDVATPVIDEIERHAFSEVSQEVGGILYGTLDDEGIVIAGSFPALKATADQTSVTFTHEVWDEVHELLDKDHAGQRIVGWYHTHPGFGIFLSDYDLFIHRNFFSDHRMVALVVDPVAGHSGWFRWQGDSIENTETFATRTAAVAPATALTPTQVRASRLSRTVPLLAVAGLALAAGGFALGNQTQSDPPPPQVDAASTPNQEEEDLAAVHAEISQLQDEKSALTARLERARGTRDTSFEYVVRRGDTLSSIAQFLYGDGRKYQRIVNANARLDPDVLTVGQRLVLPLPPTTGD